MTRPCKIGVQLPEVERYVPWPEYLDLARLRGGRRLRLGLGRRPPALRPEGRQHAGPVRGVDDARGDRGGDRAGRDRAAGGVDQLPRAGDARQAGGDGRRDLRRPADRRAGGGLEPAGVPAFGFAYDRRVSRFEEALAIIVPLLREGRTTFHGSSTTSRTACSTRGPCARAGRRSCSAPTARGCWASGCRSWTPGTSGGASTTTASSGSPRSRPGSTRPCPRAGPSRRRRP